MRLRFTIFFCMVFAALVSISSKAESRLRVAVLADPASNVHEALLEQLQRTLKTHDAESVTLDVMSNQIPANEHYDLAIGIGTEATTRLLSEMRQEPVLSVLIPQLSFEKIAAQRKDANVSAIFLDQPIVRRLNLIKLVLPHAQDVGVVLGPSTAGSEIEIRTLLQHAKLRAQVALVEPQDNPIAALEGVLEVSDVLLAIIDPLVFNRSNVPSVLLTAYRYRVPMIGVSPAYIKAGALAAVYSTPEQIGQQVAEELIVRAQNGKRLSGLHYPRYFSITVNRPVARSLGLAVPGDDLLLQRLQLQEKKP